MAVTVRSVIEAVTGTRDLGEGVRTLEWIGQGFGLGHRERPGYQVKIICDFLGATKSQDGLRRLDYTPIIQRAVQDAESTLNEILARAYYNVEPIQRARRYGAPFNGTPLDTRLKNAMSCLTHDRFSDVYDFASRALLEDFPADTRDGLEKGFRALRSECDLILKEAASAATLQSRLIAVRLGVGLGVIGTLVAGGYYLYRQS